MQPTQDLTVSILQQALIWRDPPANRARFARLIAEEQEQQQGKVNLFVLPEMFTAGFTMDARSFAEPAEGETFAWMRDLAEQTGAVLTGSYAVQLPDGVANRLLWMPPTGVPCYYDKRHLFRMAGEHKRYVAGTRQLYVEWCGWRCMPLVCYDLRFPVWCRSNSAVDLQLFVANWPAARAYHWQTLLKARAIENLCYVVGVNRVGKDGKGHDYSGDSVVLDAEGRALLEPGNVAGVFTSTLSASKLRTYRQAFPAQLDADPFTIE